MSPTKSGFVVRYTSPRALLRDHATSFAKGGMIIPWRAETPPLSTPLVVRIQAPDGTLFDLAAKSAQQIPEHGFSVVFDPVPENRPRAALDMYVRGDMFKRAVDADKPTTSPPTPAEVSAFGSFAAASSAALPFVPPPQVAEVDTAAEDLSGKEESAGGDEEETIESLPDGVPLPAPGESYPAFVLRFLNVKDFVALGEAFKNQQRLRFAYSGEPVKAGTVAELRLTLPGHNIYKMWGIVESTSPDHLTLHFDENNTAYRKAATYLDSSQAKNRMKNEEGVAAAPPVVTRLSEKMPAEDINKMPIRRRLQRMGMEDKINLALSGGKEERMALAMDGNKAVHHYLLRNAKISLDEIAFMARLPTMNPDVLEKIAENPSYTQNPSVVKALVYNPKTPTPTAIRLLDRLPRSEVMNLAKRTNMNGRLVQAAKKKVEGRKI